MPRALVPAFLFLLLFPFRADAVSARDIVELSKAGLAEEVIIALIEVESTIFSLDAATLVDLKQEGVSERVLIAMLRSGRGPDQGLPAADAPVIDQGVAPKVIILGAQEEPKPPEPPPIVYYPEPYPVPVYVHVPVPVARAPRRHKAVIKDPAGFGRFINDGWRSGQTDAVRRRKTGHQDRDGGKRSGSKDEDGSGSKDKGRTDSKDTKQTGTK
jgi:hypothetical protein